MASTRTSNPSALTEDPDPTASPRASAPADTAAGESTARRAELDVIDQPAPGPGEPLGYHPPAPDFMSQGVLNDLRQYGETVDPNTGKRLTRDDIPAHLRD
jgi:hypothetical protein